MDQRPKNLVELLKHVMDNSDRDLCSIGGRYQVKDFYLLQKVLNKESGYFVVMNNGGGKQFDILDFKNKTEVKSFVKHQSLKPYVYGYRIDKEDTVLKPLSW